MGGGCIGVGIMEWSGGCGMGGGNSLRCVYFGAQCPRRISPCRGNIISFWMYSIAMNVLLGNGWVGGVWETEAFLVSVLHGAGL